MAWFADKLGPNPLGPRDKGNALGGPQSPTAKSMPASQPQAQRAAAPPPRAAAPPPRATPAPAPEPEKKKKKGWF